MTSQLRGKPICNIVLKFGLVGLFATLTYYFLAISLREFQYGLSILLTNMIAYCIAIIVSYLGHYFWTYKARGNHGATFAKYIVSALLGCGLNSIIVHICMRLSMQYKSAIFVAIILVPTIAYIMNRKWVFRA